MSEYINYYICKKDKETGLIYPLGPFDDKGDFKCALWKSRSFYTDLHELFTPVSRNQISDELMKSIYCEYDDTNITKDKCGNGDYYSLHYCDIDKLGSKNFIKSAYYLIEDIKRYELSLTENIEFEGFYEYLSPQLYCQMLESENLAKHLKNYGKDCEGNRIEIYHASDYAFYMYPDYSSKEYEAFILNTVADILSPSYERKDYDVVVVFDRG